MPKIIWNTGVFLMYTDKPGKTSRLYKPTSKLAELASTFKSSKDDKKEDRRDRDRDRNRDVEKDYSKPVSLPVQKAGLLSQCLLVS